jgi:hypothetical protein
MPEALEAILVGGSRVAALKPVSAVISIGTGGPFGAEEPRSRGAEEPRSRGAEHQDRRRGRLDPGPAAAAHLRRAEDAAGRGAGGGRVRHRQHAARVDPADRRAAALRVAPRQPDLGAASVTLATVRGFLRGGGPAFGLPDIAAPEPAVVGPAPAPDVTGALMAVAATGLVYLAEDGFRPIPPAGDLRRRRDDDPRPADGDGRRARRRGPAAGASRRAVPGARGGRNAGRGAHPCATRTARTGAASRYRRCGRTTRAPRATP